MEKTYFGSMAVKTTGRLKSTNVYMNKQKALQLIKHIVTMIEETSEDTKLCLFIDKVREKLTITRDGLHKKKNQVGVG